MFTAIALMAATVPAATTTIYVDHREQCGGGLYQRDQQRRSLKIAKKLKADLAEKGRNAVIVRIHPGTVISDRGAPIIKPEC